MLFSELISDDRYKPRANKRSKSEDKVKQRLVLAAHAAFEDGVAKGEVDVEPERHYIQASELVDAVGATFKGRDRRLEDFNLEESPKTEKFIKDFFQGRRNYGEPQRKPSNVDPKLVSKREAVLESLDSLYALTDSSTKTQILNEIQGFREAFADYAQHVRPLKGLIR